MSNPLRGPRLAIVCIAIVALAVFTRSKCHGADDARDRKARAVLALSKADPGIAVAPTPRAAKPKCYASGHKQAASEVLPLVVFVGCDTSPVGGAVVCQWDSYPGVKSPAVVVGYPVGDRIVQDSVLACPAKPDELRKAVKAAAGKADVAPMPAGKTIAPSPLDWQISADLPGKAACICGESCKCAADKCPGGCPVAPAQVWVEEVWPGYGRVQVLRDTTATPKAAPAAVASEAAGDGLDEVNAKRAARGLRPFIRDEGLTQAAFACAAYRARYGMFGHTSNDFGFCPAGVRADSAGCAAYPASYGWLSCCTYENYTHAGAAWVVGADGRRFMHLFVRNGGPVAQTPAPVYSAPAVAATPYCPPGGS